MSDHLQFDFGSESLYRVLRHKYGVTFAHSTHAVEAALDQEKDFAWHALN